MNREHLWFLIYIFPALAVILSVNDAYGQTDALLQDGKDAVKQFQSLWTLLHHSAEHGIIAISDLIGFDVDPAALPIIVYAIATLGFALGLKKWIKNFLITLIIGAAIAAALMFVPISL